MQPDSPYRLIEALGSSQVGSVWSAMDTDNRPLTVAILDASVALDQQWRDAFAAAANGLAQPQAGGPRVLYTDFAAPSPWVACAAGGGLGAEQVFLALGVAYQPVPSDQASGPPALDVPATTDGAAAPGGAPEAGDDVSSESTQPTQKVEIGSPSPVNPWAAGPPLPTSGPPHATSAPPAPGPVSSPPHPVPMPPYVVADAMQSAPVSPYTSSSYPHSGPPYPHSGPPYPHSAPPVSPAMPAAPPAPARRRFGLVAAVAVILALAVGAAGGTLVGTAISNDKPSAPTTPDAKAETPLPPLPTPSKPGVEPPTGASWPRQWPQFTSNEPAKEISTLEGVGFGFTVPVSWDCQPVANETGFAHHRCGTGSGATEIGGDVEVRDCPSPCDAERWTAMRQAVEAWGLRWAKSGNFLYWAETTSVDGAPRYGLVFVLFWRSTQEGPLDRELVFRMTAPVNQANELRKVANSMRESLSRWEF
ncbi:hypothetical protein K1W54_30910 [Micromonospora sp. CPCC 205371]|nr:hypothetical protein [Micromonospora sp. CPCC 205371]